MLREDRMSNPYSPPKSEIESRADPDIPWPWWMLVAAFLLTMGNFAALISIPLLPRDASHARVRRSLHCLSNRLRVHGSDPRQLESLYPLGSWSVPFAVRPKYFP